ncbi:hypothetical protein HY631_04295 [Candidatus Uhrbacteria bacterium]|nr:hypothetical protein [Candidatus Uhrbacteria bacterium]
MRALALPPEVEFTQRAMEDMRILVEICDEEVGWLGTAKRLGRNFLVSEIFLPSQHVGLAHTTITSAGLEQLIDDLKQKGRPGALDSMLFWGHSHAGMEATPSQQDDRQMEKFTRRAPWFIRAVLNKRGHMQVDVYLCDEGMSYHNVSWSVRAPIPAKRLAYWQERVAACVQKVEPHMGRMHGLPVHMRRRDGLDPKEEVDPAEPFPTQEEWEAALAKPGRVK